MTSWINPDEAPRALVVVAEKYSAYQGDWHSHRRAQLVHASQGVIHVQTTEGRWVVPPQRAVWILPDVLHQVSSRQGFWLHTLYAEPAALPLPDQCGVVTVDSLINQLLMTAAGFGLDYPPDGMEARLMRVLVDWLPGLPSTPLHLPQPQDKRLRKLAALLEDNIGDSTPLEQMAPLSGLTPRTAARLFLKETGLTFGQWRQQLRLLTALEKLGNGEKVTNVALDVGYQDVSSFITLFKNAFGQTPARYFG